MISNEKIIAFIVLFNSFFLLVGASRTRPIPKGWAGIAFFLILWMSFAFIRNSVLLTWIGFGLWILGVLLPTLGLRLTQSLVLKQRYQTVYRLFSILSWLHPWDEWRETTQIYKALALEQAGKFEEAQQIFVTRKELKSHVGVWAYLQWHFMTYSWEKVLELYENQTTLQKQLRQNPTVLFFYFRALAETKQLNRFLETYQTLTPLEFQTIRPILWMYLLAFTGNRLLLQRLFQTFLSDLDSSAKAYWLALCEQMNGELNALHQLSFQSLSLPMQRSLQHRIQKNTEPFSRDSLSPHNQLLLAELEKTIHHHLELAPTVSSRLFRPWMSYLLIGLNLTFFGLEIVREHSWNPMNPYLAGGLWIHPDFGWPSIQVSRFLTANFVHFGWLHLTFNLLGLWILGPFLERVLNAGRFLSIYILSGIGAMFIVSWQHLQSGNGPIQLAGASGCIMGIIGGNIAFYLRAFLQGRSQLAQQQLYRNLLFLMIQSLFDALIPQVSGTAHLSGAILGFCLTTILLWRKN